MGHMAADAIPLPSPAAVAAGLPMAVPPSSGGYVITTIALVDASTGAAALHAIVADAARQTLDHPDPAPGGDGADWADPASEREPPASLENAVVAAHEQRIAVLRERMAALCASDAAAPELGALRDRLQRAEAARRLALVRAGSDASDDADRAAASDPGCRIGLAMVRERHHDGLSSARLTIAHRWSRAPMAASHGGAGARNVLLRYAGVAPSPVRARRRAVIAAIYAGSYHRRVALVAAVHDYRLKVVAAGYAPDRRGVRRGADPRVASQLVRARRSLAAARRALEGEVPAARPAGLLAGLWRWDGSDTWSLPPHGAAAG